MTPDQAALYAGQLYPAWYGSLIRYAARVTGSRELAQDLVQEAFLLLAEALRDGQEIRSPKAWTLKVVRRQVSRQLSLSKDRGIVFDSIDDWEHWGDRAPGPLRVEPAEPRDDLRWIFSRLTIREEEALLLRLEGFKHREIAAELNVTTGTVKTLLARALKKAQDAMRTRSKNPTEALDEPDQKSSL